MDSRLIPLSKGQFAIVDADDYERLSQYKWHARWHPQTQSYYACRNQNIAAPGEKWKNTVVRMHRQILGLERGDPRHGDHKDGNTLNYRRLNLRKSNASQDAMNRKKTAANTSGYKGVSWSKEHRKWIAYIKINGKQKFLGYFQTAELAYAAYCEAAMKIHGDFARLA